MEEFIKGNELVFGLIVAMAAVFAIRVLPKLLAGVPFVPPQDLKQQIDAGADVLIVDVREPNEFVGDLGHVPGSVNMPLGELTQKAKTLGQDLDAYKDTPVYVVCRTSNRASTAARALKRAGLTAVRIVDGGMVRWNKESLPTRR